PVITHLKPQIVPVTLRANFQQAGPGAARDAVAERVFNQRLQQQAWRERVERRRVNFDLYRKTILKACLFNLKVTLREFNLLLERDLLRSGGVESHPQQFAQAHQHAVGRRHVLLHQHRNGVERVEEKVRLKLRLQVLQFGLSETALQLRGPQFTLA